MLTCLFFHSYCFNYFVSAPLFDLLDHLSLISITQLKLREIDLRSICNLCSLYFLCFDGSSSRVRERENGKKTNLNHGRTMDDGGQMRREEIALAKIQAENDQWDGEAIRTEVAWVNLIYPV